MEPIEQRIEDELSGAGIPFEWMDCDPSLADTANFCAHYGIDPDDSANAILVVGKSEPPRHVLCVVLATTRLDVNGAVRRRLGTRKASFAPPETTRELTGMEIGGVTPAGLPDGLPVWVDSAVTERTRVVIGGGTRSRKILVAPGELARLVRVEVVEGLAGPASTA